MIFKSQGEIDMGLQFFISCLSFPALGIKEMILVDCDCGKNPVAFEFSHASRTRGSSSLAKIL